MVSDVQGMGNRYAKEISEVRIAMQRRVHAFICVSLVTSCGIVGDPKAMAVVDAVQRAIKRCLHVQCESLQGRTRVFVVGDGKVPLGAATLALHFPPTRFVLRVDGDQATASGVSSPLSVRLLQVSPVVIRVHRPSPWRRRSHQEAAEDSQCAQLDTVQRCVSRFVKLHDAVLPTRS